MAQYPSQLQPGRGERAARWAIVISLLVASLTVAFGLGWGVKELTSDSGSQAAPGASAGSANGQGTFSSQVLDEIVTILKNQYVDREQLSDQALKEAAINGIMQSLNDRETSYITPEQFKAFAFDSGSSYEGIGATVTDRNGRIEIVAPYRDSPAEKAGIRPGDVIVAVEGTSTSGWTADQAVAKIRGPKGSAVKLDVQRTDGKIETLTVERGEIPLDSVFREPILEVIPGESKTALVDRSGAPADDIAYINIARFRENTANELREKARDIESKGYKGLILDLRSNPGGYLTPTVQVADEFLNSGVIITEEDAAGKRTSTSAKRGGLLTTIPMVVLMDAGSASGSEVLAAALRDNGRARIIGQRSFGKGTVNIPVELKSCGDPQGCGALYIAIGRWLTPKGDQIEGLGITPDIEVAMTSDEYIASGDIQVFKAIDVLRGQ